ncbi:MAG: NUDIX domain-containing protein [Candidatus Magasanikbacteria bacterium]|nr:NUDIX domain-containing protein [Candidatus Magasanikbacteria bacterium]
MQEIENKLKINPVVYITRDIERATGLDLDTPGYFIITNFSSFAKQLKQDRTNILLIENEEILDTWQLMQNPKVIDFISGLDKPNILVFKNTTQIEKICKEQNWKLLNPPSETASKIEEKIPQLEWLGDLKKYLPGYEVLQCKDIEFKNKKFILQFNRSHTGSGTILIESAEQLKEIKNKFPNREARVANYIEGPIFTNNNITAGDKILLGNISYQITGLQPFTDRKFATIGNDWGVVRKILSDEQIEEYKKQAREIGEKLIKDGWKGAYGIDVVMEASTGKMYLLEVNARQPASMSYESTLQQLETTNNEISSFEAHLAALLDIDLSDYELVEIDNGAQIIQRVTKDIQTLPDINLKNNVDFKTIKYKNKKLGNDLLRIQMPYSIIKKHNELNICGKQMIDFITTTKDGKTWDNDRGGIIAIKNNKILLIERHKFGRHFFSLPGGTAHKDEKILQTAKREGKEETNLIYDIPEQTPIHINVTGRNEYYFFVKNISGKTTLGEEESERNCPNNSYELKWVDLDELEKINLKPDGIAKIILQKI